MEPWAPDAFITFGVSLLLGALSDRVRKYRSLF